jgi:glycosyltransferase involved in cell wall biosynthesis
VKEAIESVLAQTYDNIELIVVDDASTDNSAAIIKDIISDHPGIKFIGLTSNVGNCAAFNKGWKASSGEFIIDLAADDLLYPDRIQKGVTDSLKHDDIYAVQFGDAEFINEAGETVGFHSDRFPHHTVPAGDVYKHVIERYFICSPSMFVRRSVFEKLNGYDETLAYEDFDFWIRSSRDFWYFYCPTVLVKKRIVKGSMSDQQFKKGNSQQLSTYRVCEKIRQLNKTGEEDAAMDVRLLYELRKAIGRFDLGMAWKYYGLLSGW